MASFLYRQPARVSRAAPRATLRVTACFTFCFTSR
jgi:hypothetical protein